MSTDPITRSYPNLTPYQFSSNSPIANIDLDGREAKYFNIEIVKTFNAQGKLIYQVSNAIEDKTKEGGWFVHGSLYRPNGDLGSGQLFTYTEVETHFKEDGSQQITIRDNGALYIPSESDKGRGGLFFTSSSGIYTHASGSLNEDNAIPINLDELVSSVGGFPKGSASLWSWDYSGGEISKLAKLPEILKSDKDFMVKVEKVLSALKGVLSTGKAFKKIEKGTKNIIKDDNSKFFKKGMIYYDMDLKTNIERDSDTSGTLTDKKAIDTLKNE